MDYNDRFDLNSPYQGKESSTEKDGRKGTLWIVTCVLWVILVIVVVFTTVNSRRFQFYGTSLAYVSHEPRSSVTMVDDNGDYLTVTNNDGLITMGTFTVEYLGETYKYTIDTGVRSPASSWQPFDSFQLEEEPEEPPAYHTLTDSFFMRQAMRAMERGPASFGAAVGCVILGFLFLLLSVASWLYPREFWEFEQAFEWRVKNAEPTELGIMSHQIGGVVGVIAVFITAIVVLTLL